MSDSEFDASMFSELLDGDAEFGHELVAAFKEASQGYLELARQALASGKRDDGVRAFHSLKGTAASVGLVGLQALAIDCEALMKAGDLERCAYRLSAVELAVDSGLKTIRLFVEGLEA